MCLTKDPICKFDILPSIFIGLGSLICIFDAASGNELLGICIEEVVKSANLDEIISITFIGFTYLFNNGVLEPCFLVGTSIGTIALLWISERTVTPMLMQFQKKSTSDIVYVATLDDLLCPITTTSRSVKTCTTVIVTHTAITIIQQTSKNNYHSDKSFITIPDTLGGIVTAGISKIRETSFIFVLTEHGRLLGYSILPLECIWSLPIDPILDSSRFHESTITYDAYLGCWSQLGDYRMFNFAQDVSQATVRIYDLYRDRKSEQDFPKPVAIHELEKLCILWC